MTRNLQTQTNPAFIAAILEEAEKTNGHAAAHKHGIHPKTVYRWQKKRETSGGTWPTAEDIEAWQLWRAANGQSQRRAARLQREYKKKVYLQRGPVRIDGTGTRRRIQALYALGWTSTDLAPHLGVSPQLVGHLARGRLDKVNRETAAKVAKVYDELSMIRPEDPDILPPKHTRVHDRQRRQSVAKGWAPPLAWDDIDDPNEQPTGWQYVPAGRREILRELDSHNAGISEACARLKRSRDALERWCERNGMRDVYARMVARENQHREAS